METKDILFQEMSALYMDLFQLPPLTSSIFTYLFFDFEQEGLTFEEIHTAMCASKSSVSNALNRLLQSNHIEYISKLDERKRYYRVNKEIFLVQLQDTIHQMKRNRKTLDKFYNYRKENFEDGNNQFAKMNLHINLLDSVIGEYESTLFKINLLDNKN